MVKVWSLKTLQVKLINMGDRPVHHARRPCSSLAKWPCLRQVFLEQIDGLYPALG